MKKKVFRERYYEIDIPNAKEIKIETLEYDKETDTVKPAKKTAKNSKKGDK